MTKTAQLQLIKFDTTWQLDRKTIKVGKAGLASARAILAEKRSMEDHLDQLAA